MRKRVASTLDALKSVTLSSGEHVNYQYDAQGNRVQTTTGDDVTQRLVYAPGILGPVAELSSTGHEKTHYVYASRSNVPDYMVRGGHTFRLVTDQLGSVRFVVEAATGEIAQEISYDPFGEVVSDSAPGFQPFGFAGGLYDAATGLTHFGAREYDAGLGRWTSKDPIAFAAGDSNLFGYVNQDPVNWSDPSGNMKFAKLAPSLEEASDAAAGFGDGASFGLTNRIRKAIGVDDVVNYCSGSYFGGNVLGQATRDLAIAVSPAGPSSALGKLPIRSFGPKRIWKYPPKPPSPLPPKTPSTEPWGQMF